MMISQWLNRLLGCRRRRRPHMRSGRDRSLVSRLLMNSICFTPANGVAVDDLAAALAVVAARSGMLNQTDPRVLATLFVRDQLHVITGTKPRPRVGDGRIFTLEKQDGRWEIVEESPWLC